MAASAPAFLACLVSSIASSVEFEPVPAITGTPEPLAAAMQRSMTRLCSVMERVGDSPVVPHGTRPSVPSLICQATNFSNPFSSTAPFLNGVINATSDPLNMAFLPFSANSQCMPQPPQRQGEQLAIVMPQGGAYDSWCESRVPPPDPAPRRPRLSGLGPEWRHRFAWRGRPAATGRTR